MTGTTARIFAVAALAAMVSVPVMAEPPRPTAKKPPGPNDIVCEKQEVIGSRLVSRRVCMTRAQWEDLRNQDRQEIDRAQTKRGMSGN